MSKEVWPQRAWKFGAFSPKRVENFVQCDERKRATPAIGNDNEIMFFSGICEGPARSEDIFTRTPREIITERYDTVVRFGIRLIPTRIVFVIGAPRNKYLICPEINVRYANSKQLATP